MPLQTLDSFSFNHKDQQDKLYESKTATQVKEAFDSRGEDLQTKFNSAINVLKSVTDSDSGADNIGVTSIVGLTGNTVQTILEALKSLDDTNRQYLLSQIQNVVLGQIPDGAITDLKLSDDADQIKQRFATHEADYLYQTAGGTATAITLTNVVLEAGHPKTFIAKYTDSTTSKTINGKKFYKPGTTTSPSTVAGKAYTVWYDPTGDSNNGCFFIKASATGTVTSDKVLASETYSTEENTDLVGTMPNRGTFNLGLGVSVPAGYYSGGNAPNGKKFASSNTSADSSGTIIVSGLAFTPSIIEFYQLGGDGVTKFCGRFYSEQSTSSSYKVMAADYGTYPTSVSNGTFTINNLIASRNVAWLAIE